MAGIDDNVALFGDWLSFFPSSAAWFSTISDDNSGVRPNLAHVEEIKSSGYFSNIQADIMPQDSTQISNGQAINSNSFHEEKKIGEGLAERLTAKTGFQAPKLNIGSIRSSKITTNSDVRSPCLTIPPGLSPTTLLESPVFLHNSLVQQSPSMKICERNGHHSLNDITTLPFSLKNADELGSNFLDSINKTTTTSLHGQLIVGNEVTLQSGNSLQSQVCEPVKDVFQSLIEKENEKSMTKTNDVLCDVGGKNGNFQPFDGRKIEEGLKESGDSSIFDVTLSEDGYIWRKCRQKQVRGCEYPQTYYTCTHPDCPVNKKVERSREGHIVEIIYKETHNHPPPPPSRRSAIGLSDTIDFQLPQIRREREKSGVDNDSILINIQKGESVRMLECRNENLNLTSSVSSTHEFHNAKSSLFPPTRNLLESSNIVDVPSTFLNKKDEDDMATHRSTSMNYDDKGEEPKSKRRRGEDESHVTEIMGATRAITKPRVVVQTTSEVDIIDDGYRWRKYGKKVVRGNPNPRSYYKCTTPGCDVRKHVERASHDIKSVITTYEGKHNHVIPPTHNNIHPKSKNTAQINQIATDDVQSQVHKHNSSEIRSNVLRLEGPNPVNSYGVSRCSQFDTSSGYSLGSNALRLAIMPDDGLCSNHERTPVFSVNQLQEQRSMTNMMFMLHRTEPIVETMPKPCPSLPTNSSLYQQYIKILPLDHQI